MIKHLINQLSLNKYLEHNFTNKFLLTSKNLIKVGNVINITYKFMDENKEKIKSYDGLIIKINNNSLGKSFTLQHVIQGINVEQIISLNSPNIINITKKYSYKIRKAKLYYIYNINNKKLKLK